MPAVRPTATLRRRLMLGVATVALLALPGGEAWTCTETVGDDVCTISADTTNAFGFDAGNDQVTVASGVTVDNYIDLGAGNDQLTLQSSATINGDVFFGGSGTLTNAGSIVGVNTFTAVYLGGTANDLVSIDNSNVLDGRGTTNGMAIYGVDAAANVTNRVNSFIYGLIELGSGNDVVTNSGTITGDMSFGAGTDSLTNSNRIDGDITFGGSGTLTNSGTITGVTNYAVQLAGAVGTVVTLNNSGMLDGSGVTAAVYSWGGTTAHIDNAAGGTILGLLDLSDGDDVVTNAGTLTGDITLYNGDDTVTNTGTMSSYVNFGAGAAIFTNGSDAVRTATFDGQIVIDGSGTVTNYGTMTGSGAQELVSVNGPSGSTFTLENFGTLDGQGQAVLDVLTTDQHVTLTNAAGGSITGDIILYNGNDTVTNAGTLTGEIILYNGNDTVTNSGLIEGWINLDEGTKVLTNSGTIKVIPSAGAGVIDIGSGGTTTITNSGTIEALAGGSDNAIYSDGTNSTATSIAVDNTGNIKGYIQIDAGTLALTNAGTVTQGVTTAGGNDTVTNSGTITDQVDLGLGDDTVVNSGTIGAGVNLGDGNNSLTNSGSIAGNLSYGGAATTLTNSGTITGSVLGFGASTLTNSGTVSGNLVLDAYDDAVTNAGAVTGDLLLGDGDDTVILHDTGSVSGTIDGGAGSDILTLRGTTANGALNLTAQSGFETLSKADAGTWTLTGTGGFTGGAAVSAGTLVVGSGANVNADVTLAGGSLRVAGDLSGAITGSAAAETVTFAGAGALYSGALDGGAGSDKLVLSGPAGAVNATALSGFEQLHKVAEGVAELSVGGGAVGASSTHAFSFSEGVTVEGGGLHLTGDWDQAGGLFTVALVDGATPKLEATGTATLDGGLKLTYDPATLSAGQSFTLVKAGALSGTFSSVDGGARVYFQPIAYTGTTATVTVEKIGTIGDALPTAPAHLGGVIAVLDGLDASAVSPELQAVLTQLVPLGEAELQAAVADIGGAAVPVLAQATQALGNAGTGTAMGRLAALGAAPQSTVTAQVQPPVQLAFAGLGAGELVAEAAPEAAAGGRWAGCRATARAARSTPSAGPRGWRSPAAGRWPGRTPWWPRGCGSGSASATGPAGPRPTAATRPTPAPCRPGPTAATPRARGAGPGRWGWPGTRSTPPATSP